MNFENEISRNIPENIPSHYFNNDLPILTAYGCILLERDTGKSFVYTAVNIQSGKKEVISRRKNPLLTSGVSAIVEKIRKSSVVGRSVLEIDRPFGEKIESDKLKQTLETVFTELLPQHGYNVRTEQLELAKHILDAIAHRNISLAEAEVGTGKTLAYLVPAILAKRGRTNDDWNTNLYPEKSYVDMASMPVVVATSSIALQKALVADYIPELSDILMTHEVIKAPLTVVIRKGRSHYICDKKLQMHFRFENDRAVRKILKELLEPDATIDLEEVDGLTDHVKRKICVPPHCYANCKQRRTCSYLEFREKAKSPNIDIQVCNHNYILADTLHRADGKPPLIPDYQSIIIDEAHKFLSAAQSMYGTELLSLTADEIREGIDLLELMNFNSKNLIQKSAVKLRKEMKRLFRELFEQNSDCEQDEESNRLAVEITPSIAHHIRNIREISNRLIEMLSSETAADIHIELKTQLLLDLKQINEKICTLARYSDLILWLEISDDEKKLCAIPKNLNKRLYQDLWSKGVPTILTSGTLSANAGTSCARNFSHIKRTLGIERAGMRLMGTSKPSPFDFQNNALIYISDNMPFLDNHSSEYIATITDEIERLVKISNGHAAILFTSYDVMGRVYSKLKEMNLPFPMFRMEKSDPNAIDKFKNSINGVLFASGAMWEGIDIPGDILSLVIIVKLPFAVPDPISEYEQTMYKNMDEYKKQVIVPEMLIKLKQGFGRLIRAENDTGVVAILDCRCNAHGVYHEPVISALPDCAVTNSISYIDSHLRALKPLEYWN